MIEHANGQAFLLTSTSMAKNSNLFGAYFEGFYLHELY